MSIAALCPSCAAPLSEVAVLALAPVCSHCGVVITATGGTLGMTAAYGVSDASLTRNRVEADLKVLRDHLQKYRGMIESCKHQLDAPIDKYARLPTQPELLWVHPVDSILKAFGRAIAYMTGSYLAVGFGLLIPYMFVEELAEAATVRRVTSALNAIVLTSAAVAFVVPFVMRLYLADENGQRPSENAQRLAEYEKAYATEMKAAEIRKAKEDYELRNRIRELEGLSVTIRAKEAEVNRVLSTLHV